MKINEMEDGFNKISNVLRGTWKIKETMTQK